MQKKLFTELGLSPELLKAIDKIGFEEASPIQSAAIPELLAGSDVVGQSQTGSGKTAAFAIPAVEKVDPGLRAPQVLILTPTRELAVQVAEEVAKLAAFKRGVRELPIYGGQSYERQFRGLQQGAQIIIGTPGRVMDHLDRRTLRLEQLRMVILDEADRMLDMGFLEDIKTVLSHAPEERQTVLFSATLPRPIQELVKSFTRNPVSVRIEAHAATIPAIEQLYYEVERRSKLDVLCRLIDLDDIKFGLVFCATKMMVDELAEHLAARGYAADKLHGDMTQAMRERVMAKFRKRGIEFLVATDVAARGLDVDDIEVVFNYDLPHDAEDYVHRIGRTGRAGRSGRAITFVAGREIYKLQNIVRFTKGRIRRERVPSLDEVQEKRANAFFDALRETLEKGEYQRQDALIDRLLEQGYSPTDIASALIHLAETGRAAAGAAGGAVSGSRALSGKAGPRERSQPGPVQGAPVEALVSEYKRDRKSPQPTVRDRGAERPEVRPTPSPKKKSREVGARFHEPGMMRLAFNIGRDQKVWPGDVVGVILGAAHLTKEAVGAIHVLPNVTLVEVAEQHAAHVVRKLNGIRFKGHRIEVTEAE